MQVQTSCGYGVPWLKDLEELEANEEGPRARLEDRKTLGHWASQTVEKGAMEAYRAKNNARSLDDTAGLKAARRTKGEIIWLEDAKIYTRKLVLQWDAILVGMLLAFLVVGIGGGLHLLETRLLPFVGMR